MTEKPFCSAPFIQPVLLPNGDVLPCCIREDYVLGSMKNASLTNIWRGAKAENLRNEFRTGKIVTCAQDIENKKCHRRHKDYDRETKLHYLWNNGILKLDVRLNGRCNLECITCKYWQEPNGVYDQTTFWQECTDNIFPHIKEIWLLGGEPFIQKDTFRLIDTISEINPDCGWRFTTNGHWAFNHKIKKYLEKIKINGFIVSIDSLNEKKYQTIRKKGELKRVLLTLDQLKTYRHERAVAGRGFQLKIDMVVQRNNYLDVLEFATYAESKEIEFSFIYLESPKIFSLSQFTKEEKQFYLATLLKFRSKVKDQEPFNLLMRHLVAALSEDVETQNWANRFLPKSEKLLGPESPSVLIP